MGGYNSQGILWICWASAVYGCSSFRKESVHDMWSAQKGFCRPVFAATMSRDSFVNIKGRSVLFKYSISSTILLVFF